MRFLLGSLLFGLSAWSASGQVQSPPIGFRTTVPNDFTVSRVDINFVGLALRAAILSRDVQSTDPSVALASIPGGRLFTSAQNQAIVGRLGDVCYAAFSGNPVASDVTGLFPPVAESALNTAVVGPNGPCPVVEAWRRDLQDQPYFLELVSTLRSCQGTANTPIVLTGFGTGGAVAQVASVFLSNGGVNDVPFVITFGQPPATSGLCATNIINPKKVVRFGVTREFNGGITYDPAPYLNFPGASQYGSYVVFSPQDFSGVKLYASPEQNPFIESSNWADANFQDVHNPALYAQQIDNLLDFFGILVFDPLPTLGFNDGQQCTQSSECSKDICSQGECGRVQAPTRAPTTPTAPTLPPSANGGIGDECITENDCLDRNTCTDFRCVSRLPIGAICDIGDDCISDICRSFFFFSICFIL